MSPKSSDLSPNVREMILRQMREQIGSDQYEQMEKNYGEDTLIDWALETMKQNAGRSGPKKIEGLGGLIAGFIMGVIAGSVFLVASWLLNIVLSVPYGHSLAALTNGAVITVPASIFLAWLRTKEIENIDFRTVFSYYTLASLIGGLMGVGRWLLHSEASVMDTFVNPLWDMVGSTCFPIVFCVGLSVALVMWVVSLGQNFCDPYDVAGWILIRILILLSVASLIAWLADAPLGNGILPLLNQNVVLVTLVVTAGLGGLLGLIWPPQLQET